MLAQEEFLRKIIQYLNNPEDKALLSELNQITNESDEYKLLYDQTIFLWESTAEMRVLDEINVDAAVLQLEVKLTELHGQNTTQTILAKNWGLNKWAAIAAVLFLGIVAYWGYNQSNKVNYLVKITKGVIDSVTLADGSKIFLDEFSELKYPDNFKGKLREIDLVKGQAFFKVHRDTLHPFVVSIRHSSVTVLGTSFNIDSRDLQIALNVKTGKVKFRPIASEDGGDILPAGTGIVYDENKNLATPAFNLSNQYWLTHEIDFIDASLIEVCKQLEACYKVKITLDANTSAFKKFNAHFKDNKLNDVIEVLRNTYPIKVKQLPDGSLSIKSTLSQIPSLINTNK